MITRIVCSRNSRKGQRPHELGYIDADPAGLLLTYCEAALTTPSDRTAVMSPQDGLYYRRDGAKAQMREPSDFLVEIDLWCEPCRTGHPVDVRGLFRAAKRRRRNVQLTSRGAWEGMWD